MGFSQIGKNIWLKPPLKGSFINGINAVAIQPFSYPIISFIF
jgi:hypothetical protein